MEPTAEIDSPWASTGCQTCDRSLIRADWFDEDLPESGVGASIRAAVADRMASGHSDCPAIPPGQSLVRVPYTDADHEWHAAEAARVIPPGVDQ